MGTHEQEGPRQGRARRFSDEEAEAIREHYYSGGRGISMPYLARLHRVSTATIANVIDQRGAYAAEGDDE